MNHQSQKTMSQLQPKSENQRRSDHRACSPFIPTEEQIIAAILRGGHLELSDEAQRHIDQCPHCQAQLPFWRQAVHVCWEQQQFDEMVIAAIEGDAGIQTKEVSAGLALFKPAEGSSPGVLLIVDPEDWEEIRAVHRDVDAHAFELMR